MEHITITFDGDTTNIDINAPTQRAIEALARVLAEYMYDATQTPDNTTGADNVHETFTEHLIHTYNTLILENTPGQTNN